MLLCWLLGCLNPCLAGHFQFYPVALCVENLVGETLLGHDIAVLLDVAHGLLALIGGLQEITQMLLQGLRTKTALALLLLVQHPAAAVLQIEGADVVVFHHAQNNLLQGLLLLGAFLDLLLVLRDLVAELAPLDDCVGEVGHLILLGMEESGLLCSCSCATCCVCTCHLVLLPNRACQGLKPF